MGLELNGLGFHINLVDLVVAIYLIYVLRKE
jgi:hypothetical protein